MKTKIKDIYYIKGYNKGYSDGKSKIRNEILEILIMISKSVEENKIKSSEPVFSIIDIKVIFNNFL